MVTRICKFKAQPAIEYGIEKATDIFNQKKKLFSKTLNGSRRRLIIIDQSVDKIWGENIRAYCDNVGIEANYLIIECSEPKKNIDTVMQLLEKMNDLNLIRRSEPVIAIGGGILLDMVGFAAALYKRGIPYIRIPTTLVGMVDAAVGLKVGINSFDKRNRLGNYYSPQKTVIDRQFLQSLPIREIKNGMSEILKLAIIHDEVLFSWIEKHGIELKNDRFQTTDIADMVIERSITKMVEQLIANPREDNLRRLVDFGHSFSPYIEMKSHKFGPALSHGEAVILDVFFSCVIACNRKILKPQALHRIKTVIKELELKQYHHLFFNQDNLEKALLEITIHRNGSQNIPLPSEIGSGDFYSDLNPEDLQNALIYLNQNQGEADEL